MSDDQSPPTPGPDLPDSAASSADGAAFDEPASSADGAAFEAQARAAGAALRKPAPDDAIARLSAARHRQRVVRGVLVGAAGVGAVALIALVALIVRPDDDAVVPANPPVTPAATSPSATEEQSADSASTTLAT